MGRALGEEGVTEARWSEVARFRGHALEGRAHEKVRMWGFSLLDTWGPCWRVTGVQASGLGIMPQGHGHGIGFLAKGEPPITAQKGT